MRKWWLALLLLSSASLQARGYWCYDPYLALWGEYGYQRRQEGPEKTVVVNTDSGKKVLKTQDLTKRFGWGHAFRAGASTGTDLGELEAQYTYYLPWSDRQTVYGNGSLSAPFQDPLFTFDYVNADSASAKYKSWLQGGEVNFWYHITPPRCDYFSFSWDFGLRFVYLREKFNLSFTREDDTSDYDITTKNLLYGPQLGARFEMNPISSLTWTFQIKGAAFLNDAENQTYLGDDNNFFTLRDYTKKRWTTSFLLDGFGQIAYHWTPCFSIHFSYEGYIVTGLALAPDQLDFHTDNERILRERGQIVVDGLYAGVTLSF